MKFGQGKRRKITEQIKASIREWYSEGKTPKEINMGLEIKHDIRIHPSTIWKITHHEYSTDR